MKPRLNREWHLANPMPKKPTREQRYAWHLEHEQACACRPMPESLRREINAAAGASEGGVTSAAPRERAPRRPASDR
jgi:hypothetical protein